jgi:hypothetical protein
MFEPRAFGGDREYLLGALSLVSRKQVVCSQWWPDRRVWSIAFYSVIDGHGVRLSVDWQGFTVWLVVLVGSAFVLLSRSPVSDGFLGEALSASRLSPAQRHFENHFFVFSFGRWNGRRTVW